ncbi:MAG: hypothetical protein ACI9X8_000242 [Pseudoalteromonas distincta]|jgi:hypothetical protein
MEKVLNLFGLTTQKQAQIKTELAVKEAVENALGEKPYKKVLDFVRVCRKYSFKVVAVGVDDEKAMGLSRQLAEKEFNADMSEQREFSFKFIPNVKPTNDIDLLK